MTTGGLPAAASGEARADAARVAPDGWTAGRRALLALIVVVGAGLRFWGLGFGLDAHDPSRAVLNNQVDERSMAQSVLDGFLAGHLDPGDFLFRGPGGFVVFGVLDAAVLLPSALAHPGGWSGLRADLNTHLSRVILLHRTWSALAGVATILALARLVRRRLGQDAGLIAAALAATFYLHVRESHFGTVDALFVLLFTCALDALLDVARDGTRGACLRAGLFAGATTAVKYFGGALVLHALLAFALARRRARAYGRPAPPWTALGWIGLAMVAGFLALSPSVLLDPRPLLENVNTSLHSYGIRSGEGTFVELVAYHARISAFTGLGAAPTALAACGLLLGLLRGGALRLPAAFALLTLPCVLSVNLPAVRYALPLLVALLPLAAGAAVLLLVPLLARPGFAPRAAAAAAVVACLLPGALRSADFDSRVARTDTRLLMLDRLAALAASPEDIWAFGSFGLPRLPEALPSPFTDVYRQLVHRKDFVAHIEEHPPRYVLWDVCAMDLQPWTGLDLGDLLARRYREIARFDPRPDPRTLPLDVVTDSGTPQHVLSFTRPGAVDRPGPLLVLFELRTD